ncbi:uncharacterized protein BDZ99DRAFT_526102 [Mytilinidion resinicola]|uniref:Uncharacterized protein n=1 Tax=Mytilinidion resinicola TaxID=574789 RepID=A0A6A6Y6B6_9PEZI|nr:uncharacterized protein BDZ99DRAFT_526102 [Mytilinidion resinicola]KAF2804063.1 hypothetical protein BDZ99DRAFT_526102 [Mytilinidion resinicola]
MTSQLHKSEYLEVVDPRFAGAFPPFEHPRQPRLGRAYTTANPPSHIELEPRPALRERAQTASAAKARSAPRRRPGAPTRVGWEKAEVDKELQKAFDLEEDPMGDTEKEKEIRRCRGGFREEMRAMAEQLSELYVEMVASRDGNLHDLAKIAARRLKGIVKCRDRHQKEAKEKGRRASLTQLHDVGNVKVMGALFWTLYTYTKHMHSYFEDVKEYQRQDIKNPIRVVRDKFRELNQLYRNIDLEVEKNPEARPAELAPAPASMSEEREPKAESKLLKLKKSLSDLLTFRKQRET